MQQLRLALGVALATAIGGVSQAAVPSSVFGKWIERLPDGQAIVTEFTAASISCYRLDPNGRATAAPTSLAVTYLDLGGPMIGVSFNAGGGATVARKGADAITLDFPGIGGPHELTRVKAPDHPDYGETTG